MSALLPETFQKAITPEFLRSAAKQSSKCHVIPVRLDRAIKKYLQEQEMGHMKKKVLRLSESFSEIKDVNRMLPMSISKELVEDPLKSLEQSKRWKIKSVYGEIGLAYRDDETAAYVASRMPAVYSACYRILKEIRRRLPGFSPAKVLDFGSGTGSAFWALRDVWPRSLERVNLIEPSQSMQRAGLSLLQDIKKLPLIHSYGSIQSLSQDIKKSERPHDLVIASYVLGEIPSLKDRITTVRQLWNLTGDILVLIEPGTPEGSNIISQMRSHILWMEKRKSRKRKNASEGSSESPAASSDGAFIVAPCPHDGPCPLAKTGKYCHFVQRMERTESQRAYKRSGSAPLRGFEDEKFSYVAFRRGKRPQEPWPLDGLKFETLKELRARRNPEDLEVDYDDQFGEESDEIMPYKAHPSHESDAAESDAFTEYEDEEEGEEAGHADLGSGWGRIIFMPQKRGRRIEMDVCRSTKRDGSEGLFEHLVITKAKNPALHHQARKSFWGDLWPF
uniref:Uncharacterized protein n=1 Tax=Opuntia streptacantha TaxID=393608 RepID=A0A7C9AM75_OPUST